VSNVQYHFILQYWYTVLHCSTLNSVEKQYYIVLYCYVLHCNARTSDNRFDQLLTPKTQRERREKGKMECNMLRVVRKEKRRGGKRRKVERKEKREKRRQEKRRNEKRRKEEKIEEKTLDENRSE
jgi:hypothetical protein